MNGVVQAQTQRPKIPAGPAPLNVPPTPPPAQKTASNNQHPGHLHTRSSQQSTTQPPPNRNQPAANGRNQGNKKKADPAPVDPAAMYESLKNRIAALEEEETHGEEEERTFGAPLRYIMFRLRRVDQAHALRFCS